MNIVILPSSGTFSPNPVNINTAYNVAIPIYEYVPDEYRISVRYLVSSTGKYYTTRNGKRFLVPVKVAL